MPLKCNLQGVHFELIRKPDLYPLKQEVVIMHHIRTVVEETQITVFSAVDELMNNGLPVYKCTVLVFHLILTH